MEKIRFHIFKVLKKIQSFSQTKKLFFEIDVFDSAKNNAQELQRETFISGVFFDENESKQLPHRDRKFPQVFFTLSGNPTKYLDGLPWVTHMLNSQIRQPFIIPLRNLEHTLQ